MKKYLLFLLAPVLFSATKVDSTEIAFLLSNQENYQFNYKKSNEAFQTVPSNPNVFSEVDTFLDLDLTKRDGTIKKNQSFKIVDSQINSQNQLVFVLEDGRYLLADTNDIYDDMILESLSVTEVYWLKKNFTLYSSPISNEQTSLTSKLKAYQAVTISEIARTQDGEFAKIAGHGWVATEDLSREDNRIEAVQELLTKKYNSSQFSIYVKQLSSQESAGIHEDTKMYAASISKLPVLYYVEAGIQQGQYKLTDTLQYIDKVTSFKGSYKAEGSGSMSKSADNKSYSVIDLIDKTAKESDNAASNLLAYYATNQFDQAFYETITAITGEKWDMESRLASAEMAGLVMEALYQQGGYSLESLQSTRFDDQRIAKDLPVAVAHKIGDAYDFRHDVAVVYADSPFVLSIFTNQSDYDSISKIANEIYGILK